MATLRKWLILSHRYLGIALSLLFVMWFASGIVMIYAGGMPRLTPEVRLDRLPPLDMSRVRLNPEAAAAKAGLQTPARATLSTVMGRPAYRFGGRNTTTVFADTGDVLEPISEAESRTVASRFADVPENRLRHVGQLSQPDQWTLTAGRQGGLQKYAADDDAGTELYVSPRSAEVVMATTRRERMLAWMGVIPHWMYFANLRLNQPMWYRVMVWSSTIGCAVAVLGLLLGLTQWRRTRPFRLSSAIPYTGWMRWHYVTGVVFGVFTLTWMFSGLLSMEPYAWTNATGLEVDRDAFSGGPPDLARFALADRATWSRFDDGRPIKEIELVNLLGEANYVVRHPADPRRLRGERLHQEYPVTGRAERERVLVSATTLEVRDQPFTTEAILARLQDAVPDERAASWDLLSEYDSYYYSRGRQTPLPVLRVKFSDPAETWVYIDPEMGQVLAEIHRLNRVERWLYSGLHNLDFRFLYETRPLWDVVMIVLSLGGLASSAIGVVIGVRRIRRGLRASVRAGLAAAPSPLPQPAGREHALQRGNEAG
jgi:uncharacterized iron-regulated membrane protein